MLTFGLLKCHEVWHLMQITSQINNVYDGNNKRAHSIFHPLRVSSKKNAVEAIEMICAAYGKNAINHATCKRWYKKFRQGDFSFKDEPRAERPQKIETDKLQALLDINSAQTKKKLAEQLDITQQFRT